MAVSKAKATLVKESSQELIGRNEYLEKELLEMKVMMQSLMQKNETKDVNSMVSKHKIEIEEDEIEFDVSMNKMIKIMSLTQSGMTLVTARNGGKEYRFNDFGSIMPILYADVLAIISTHTRLAQEGFFVLLDKKAVVASGLSSYYDKFLTKEKIENIMDYEEDIISDLFGNTTKHIQETILEFLYKSISEGVYPDRNKLAAIEKIANIDIMKMADVYKNGITGVNQ